MWRPLGAQEAPSLLPLLCVKARAFEPSGLMAQRSNPLDVRRVKRMVSPRGDHRGCVSYDSAATSAKQRPSQLASIGRAAR